MRSSSVFFVLILTFVRCDVCPDGYAQAPCAWDCFQVINFFTTFDKTFIPYSFDEAEIVCNQKSGGMLASIHSQEENDWALTLKCGVSAVFRNIGLKCKGKNCKWDDGSPVTYTNFKNEPVDDGMTRCYGYKNGQWEEKGCGEQPQDCWVCRIKARTIECSEGETEYKGGCISVHSTPLDKKSAEAACPGGGHLVSIHSSNYENNVYKNAALNAGLNGTIYFGAQLKNGDFEWTDGSYYINGASNWANGFPNPVFGSCVQMLLASEFGVQGQWTNVDCTTEQPYMCFRDGSDYNPETAPHPKADAKCTNSTYTNDGTIYSPNFPLSIPSCQTCEYFIEVDVTRLKMASLRFTSFDCPFNCTLTIFDGFYSLEPFATVTSLTPPSPDQLFIAESSYIRMVFSASDETEGSGWQMEYEGVL